MTDQPSTRFVIQPEHKRMNTMNTAQRFQVIEVEPTYEQRGLGKVQEWAVYDSQERRYITAATRVRDEPASLAVGLNAGDLTLEQVLAAQSPAQLADAQRLTDRLGRP